MKETSSWLPGPAGAGALDALLGAADRVVEMARSRGAQAAECFIQSAVGRSLSVERNQLAATEHSGEAGMGLRVVKDRRVGFAYFTDLADSAGAIDRALDAAGRGTKSGFELPVPAKQPGVEGLWDERIVGRSVEDLAQDARVLVQAALEVDPSITVAGGSVGDAAEAYVVVNSEGVQVAHRATETGAGLYVVARRGDEVATGQHSHEATTLDETARDPGSVSRLAAQRAKDLLSARPLEKEGKMRVVFTPEAFGAIMEFMVLPAFLGERAARGESVYAGRDGEVADRRLRLVDDPTRAGGLGSAPSCDEGLPSRAVPLLEDGRLGRFLHDVSSAYRWGDGRESFTAGGVRTGGLSDGRSYQDPPTATPRNVVLEASGAKGLDALLGDVEEGLLVVDVLGAHTGNRTSGDFSVTCTQLWRIVDGARGPPVAGAMLAGNLPQLLLDGFLGVSREREQVSGHFSPTGLDFPYVALEGVTGVPA